MKMSNPDSIKIANKYGLNIQGTFNTYPNSDMKSVCRTIMVGNEYLFKEYFKTTDEGFSITDFPIRTLNQCLNITSNRDYLAQQEYYITLFNMLENINKKVAPLQWLHKVTGEHKHIIEGLNSSQIFTYSDHDLNGNLFRYIVNIPLFVQNRDKIMNALTEPNSLNNSKTQNNTSNPSQPGDE